MEAAKRENGLDVKRSTLISTIGLLIVFGVCAGLIFVRAQIVDAKIGTYIACLDCFNLAVLKADLVMFSLTAGILLVAGLIRPSWLGRVLHFGLGILFLIHATDLVVFQLFTSRLFLSDAALFAGSYAALWNQFSTGMGGWLPASTILLSVILMFVLLVCMPPVRNFSARLALVSILMITIAAQALLDTEPYVNEWAVTNVFSANFATTERKRYSEPEASRLMAAAEPERKVVSVPGADAGGGRNVILVMLESWSSWHSELFGGDQSWTPRLDAAARRGLRLTNFHSIGFSTDKGLVGVLAGQQIWSPFLHWFETPPFHSMWGVERTLPAVFNKQGYQTAFLTTGPLDLYQKGAWLLDLGFDYVEGNEHPFYAKQPRYAFDAASDEALYQRALQWQAQANAPWLLVLETVTTHQPYEDPETGERSLERAMRYADRELGAYLDILEQSGYFENGILMIVSDHRSMTPIPASEREAFGPGVHSRVPAFIIGNGFAPDSVDSRVYSQADLVPSFELWMSGHTILFPHQASMLGVMRDPAQPVSAEPGNCAFHSRGDLRGRVEVICNAGHGQVRLDGDRTRFVYSEGLDENLQTEILTSLAVLRLKGWQRQQRHEQKEVDDNALPQEN